MFGFVEFEAVTTFFREGDGAKGAFGGGPEVLPGGVKCGQNLQSFAALDLPKRSLGNGLVFDF